MANILTGHGKPSILLPGFKGQIYEDLDTGKRYECNGERGFVRVDGDDQDNQFNWVLKGVDISYNDLQDKPEQGGGVSSWNDLTDKPFYAPIVYEFDGNTEGLDSFNNGHYNYYKVSDDILTVEQLVGGTLTLLYGGTESNTFDIPPVVHEQSGCIFFEGVIIVYNYQETSTAVGFAIPSNGIYFANSDEISIKKLTTSAKTIDKACLPAIGKADLPSIEVDDLPSIPFSKIKKCPVVYLGVSITTLVGSAQPTFNVFYDDYTYPLDEFLAYMQNGHVIFELSDEIRLFPVNVNNSEKILSIELLKIYDQELYDVQLAYDKADGRFFRNSMRVFTAR